MCSLWKPVSMERWILELEQVCHFSWWNCFFLSFPNKVGRGGVTRDQIFSPFQNQTLTFSADQSFSQAKYKCVDHHSCFRRREIYSQKILFDFHQAATQSRAADERRSAAHDLSLSLPIKLSRPRPPTRIGAIIAACHGAWKAIEEEHEYATPMHSGSGSGHQAAADEPLFLLTYGDSGILSSILFVMDSSSFASLFRLFLLSVRAPVLVDG